MPRIEHYETPDGSDPIQEWLGKLRDKRARATVLRRLDRLAAGNFGDHFFCGDGVWELRIDLGPGYRVYYALGIRGIIFLLCAGDKRKQQADIKRAAGYWRDIQCGGHH
jgi:putative addiction module killer protein